MPPKRPPRPVKKTPAPPKPKFKFTLNPVQRLQVEIIDWKRRSVRCLLIIAHVTLIHLLVYIIILGYGYHLIQKSEWLQLAFYGFFFDIGLYFFGSGASLKAITFVWRPVRFFCGIISIIFGITVNLLLFFFGTWKAHSYNNQILPLPLPNCTEGSPDIEQACKEVEPITVALFMMPIILPPVSLVCVVLASLSAYKAIYVIPDKLGKGEVDAVWLEPYETYDFYVGRNIPRIPGYDDDVHFNTPVQKWTQELDTDDEDDDQDTEDTDIIGMISGRGSGGGKKRKRPPAHVDPQEEENSNNRLGSAGGAKNKPAHHHHHPPPHHPPPVHRHQLKPLPPGEDHEHEHEHHENEHHEPEHHEPEHHEHELHEHHEHHEHDEHEQEEQPSPFELEVKKHST